MYKFLNIIRNKIFAFIYPLINNFVSEENKFLRNYVTDRTSGDILEIGAGNGGNINYYKNYNNLYLLDNNIDLLKKITSIEKCTLILASSDYLPFKKSSFDSIVTSLVICSVKDVGKTFDELNRVLKSKGKYFFWEHTIVNNKITYIIKNIFILIWKFFTGGCNYNIDNILNIKSIKWGKLKIYKKQSRLVKFLGLYYIYGEIYKY